MFFIYLFLLLLFFWGGGTDRRSPCARRRTRPGRWVTWSASWAADSASMRQRCTLTSSSSSSSSCLSLVSLLSLLSHRAVVVHTHAADGVSSVHHTHSMHPGHWPCNRLVTTAPPPRASVPRMYATPTLSGVHVHIPRWIIIPGSIHACLCAGDSISRPARVTAPVLYPAFLRMHG